MSPAIGLYIVARFERQLSRESANRSMVEHRFKQTCLFSRPAILCTEQQELIVYRHPQAGVQEAILKGGRSRTCSTRDSGFVEEHGGHEHIAAPSKSHGRESIPLVVDSQYREDEV